MQSITTSWPLYPLPLDTKGWLSLGLKQNDLEIADIQLEIIKNIGKVFYINSTFKVKGII